MELIDLRSDTLTKLKPEDLLDINYDYIGDDCYNEDRYVKMLEFKIADLFGKESALFMPSGTMSNQVALRALSKPGEELITEVGYHVCFFESSQTAALNGLVINNVHTKSGILTTSDVLNAFNNKARWSNLYATPKIISIESSISTYGGMIFPLDEISQLRMLCDERKMSLFLDGARVLNACVSLGISPKQYTEHIDMLNLCLSKGVGSPFGSMLIGRQDEIDKAKKIRKWYGGALHQSGLMAAIALNKLKNYSSRLERDHINAKSLELICTKYFQLAYPVETNIVMIKSHNADALVNKLKEYGVLAAAWTANTVRFVTSSNINHEMINQIKSIFETIDKHKGFL
ncbi:threonine aldolase family protein [Providencia sp. PROV152]|uniref:threonine aldolase family protein n=1 Tax=Providencia sp. PROV152 TaxID=2949862 RepID=UPI002348FC6B|nr:GntG family PLP-dependent aldolase [Providencia sp. PROV152]